MKNGQKPINPILETEFVSFGLTKREYFAGLAMHGLLANSSFSFLNIQNLNVLAVEHADELLKQLEK